MRAQNAKIKLVNTSADKELFEIAQRLLQYNVGDHIPDNVLDQFQTKLKTSTYSSIIVSTAAVRLRTAKDHDLLYHNAYDDLMSLCRHIVHG